MAQQLAQPFSAYLIPSLALSSLPEEDMDISK